MSIAKLVATVGSSWGAQAFPGDTYRTSWDQKPPARATGGTRHQREGKGWSSCCLHSRLGQEKETPDAGQQAPPGRRAQPKKGPGGEATRSAAKPRGPPGQEPPGPKPRSGPERGGPGGRARWHGGERGAEQGRPNREPAAGAARPGGQTTAARADRKPAAKRGRREAERESRGGAGRPAGAKRRGAAGAARRRGRATAQPGRKAPGVRKRGGPKARPPPLPIVATQRSGGAGRDGCPPGRGAGPGPQAPLASQLLLRRGRFLSGLYT